MPGAGFIYSEGTFYESFSMTLWYEWFLVLISAGALAVLVGTLQMLVTGRTGVPLKLKYALCLVVSICIAYLSTILTICLWSFPDPLGPFAVYGTFFGVNLAALLLVLLEMELMKSFVVLQPSITKPLLTKMQIGALMLYLVCRIGNFVKLAYLGMIPPRWAQRVLITLT